MLLYHFLLFLRLECRSVKQRREAAGQAWWGAGAGFTRNAFHVRRPFMQPDLTSYLLVGAVLFVCGVICMATKRNGIGVLMGVELVLNGANVNFVAFSKYTALGLDGQVFSLFVIVLAAAEAAVALAIALNFYNNHLTIDVDRGNKLKG